MQYCIGCGGYLEVGPAGYCENCQPLLPERESKMLLTYAHRIALQQRGEEHLQSVEILQAKLSHELEEFQAEVVRPTSEEQRLDLLSEAADLVYYAAQLDAQGVNVRPQVNKVLASAHIPRWTAMQAALVKYESRSASANNKNKDVERNLLRAIK